MNRSSLTSQKVLSCPELFVKPNYFCDQTLPVQMSTLTASSWHFTALLCQGFIYFIAFLISAFHICLCCLLLSPHATLVRSETQRQSSAHALLAWEEVKFFFKCKKRLRWDFKKMNGKEHIWLQGAWWIYHKKEIKWACVLWVLFVSCIFPIAFSVTCWGLYFRLVNLFCHISLHFDNKHMMH